MTARQKPFTPADFPPESDIQRAVFAHLKARAAPGVFAFHVPNGGYRNKREAAILSGMGVVPGVPDIILIHKGRAFGLELKAANGRPTERQLAAHAAMDEAGAFVCVAEGLDRALKVLEAWGLLKPDRASETYDAQRDFAGSLEVGYASIRQRMAAGGKGWEPSA